MNHKSQVFLGNSAYMIFSVMVALTACSSGKLPHKPIVENRNPAKLGGVNKPYAERSAKVTENDGDPRTGTYVVKSGDTLVKIGLENGHNWRDIARWNRLENPDRIEIGQVLRLSADPSALPEVKPVQPEKTASNNDVVAAKPAEVAPASASTSTPEDGLVWAWPTTGPITQPFDGVRNKGLAFAGKLGDPVYAAGDGKVVYAGSGLRGYGKLIIIRHNPQYLSAYAHNDSLLVAEEQNIKRGQKIATMGKTDAEDYKLHFEIRRLGKPIDPKNLLPQK